MSKTNIETVSVVICTRNRGTSIVETIKSILANERSQFELVIMDQSETDSTELAVKPLLEDSRVKFFRTKTKGLGICRNLALEQTHCEIVLMTDDDCIVPKNWIGKMVEIFEKRSAVALAFSAVDAGVHDSSLGYIPAYHPKGSYLVSTSYDKCKARGIGASMAFRKSVVVSLGGYDEMLGAGGVFFGCEDGDMSTRVLIKGHSIYETDEVSVLHNGFRTWEQGKSGSMGDFFGIGASYSKPFKCGRWDFWVVPAYEFFFMALVPPFKNLLNFRKPTGVKRIIGFVKGFSKGLRTKVDRDTLLFVSQNN